MDIFAELEKLRREHYVNDADCWFSCPKSGECCDEWMITHAECTCGAGEHNETLDGVIEWLKDPIKAIEDIAKINQILYVITFYKRQGSWESNK